MTEGIPAPKAANDNDERLSAARKETSIVIEGVELDMVKLSEMHLAISEAALETPHLFTREKIEAAKAGLVKTSNLNIVNLIHVSTPDQWREYPYLYQALSERLREPDPTKTRK